MPIVLQSKIQLKFLTWQFQETGEKCSEVLAKFYGDFRPSISRENGRKKFHKYSPHIRTSLHKAWTKNLFIAILWELWCWDPNCLVQGPNSWISRKSIREGASSLFGWGPERPKNVYCSRATPDLHRCKLGVALEQETFWDSPALTRKKLLAPYRFSQGPLNGGGFKQGGFPIWTFLSFFVLLVLFCPFLSFPGFSRFAWGWSGDFPDSSLFSFLAY